MANLWSQAHKRAEKLGMRPITLTELYTITEIRDASDISDVAETLQTYTIVDVEGERPVLKGWIFAARLEHTDAGVLLRRVPYLEAVIPAEYLYKDVKQTQITRVSVEEAIDPTCRMTVAPEP